MSSETYPPILDKNNISKVDLATDTFNICYIGNMNAGSGLILDEVIKSATYLIRQIDFKFYLVGDGPLRRDLERLAQKLRVSDYVEFTGWVPRKKAYGFILASDVCLVPFRKSYNADLGCPHKLFEYMSLEKPVISTPLRSIVKMAGEAIYLWEPTTARKLSEIICELYRNADLRSKLGQMGRRLVEEKYNWGIEEKKLLEMYKLLQQDLTR